MISYCGIDCSKCENLEKIIASAPVIGEALEALRKDLGKSGIENLYDIWKKE